VIKSKKPWRQGAWVKRGVFLISVLSLDASGLEQRLADKSALLDLARPLSKEFAPLARGLGSGQQVVIFVQEDCLACRQQLAQATCLEEAGWQVALVAIGRNRLALMQELGGNIGRTAQVGWLRTWQQASSLGIVGTPTLWFHRHNEVEGVSYGGLQTCDNLGKFLSTDTIL
jgi:hypothetical protein